MTTLKQARLIAGKVQDGNSKILGSTYSLPPLSSCKVGATLATIEGSVCHACYDVKSYRMYPSVRVGRGRNLTAWETAIATDTVPEWSEALAHQIESISQRKQRNGLEGAMLHRWFTGGDLQGIEMLRAFVYIAKLLPHVRFWLPTKEKQVVKQYLATTLEGFPSNLCVRVSGAMINGAPPKGLPNTSVVYTETTTAYACGASEREGNCGPCTACWTPSVPTIGYRYH